MSTRPHRRTSTAPSPRACPPGSPPRCSAACGSRPPPRRAGRRSAAPDRASPRGRAPWRARPHPPQRWSRARREDVLQPHLAPAGRYDVEIVADVDAEPAEPADVDVARVLVKGLGGRDRPDGEHHLASGRLEHLRAVERGRIAAPVRHHDSSPRVVAGSTSHACTTSTPVERQPRVVRSRAGRHDREVRRERLDRGDVGAPAEPDLHVRAVEQVVVVTPQSPASSSCIGALPAIPTWPPTSLGGLEHDDRVAARRGLRGRRQAGRPAPTTTTRRVSCRLSGRAKRPLSPGARILRARDRRLGVVVRDAGVAADAAQDLSGSPARALRGMSGSVISARFIPQASTAPLDQPSALARIDDPRRRDQRHGGEAFRPSARSRSRVSAAAGTMPTHPWKVDESPIATCT